MYQDALQSNISPDVHPRSVNLPLVPCRVSTYRPYIPDPQSHIWDPLDSDMMQRLSAREWVSLAIERALKISSNSLTSFLQSDRATTSNFGEELNMGPSKFKLAVEYAIGQDRKQDSEGKEATDCFHAGTPGALSLEEVEEKIDLGQWKLKLGQRLVKLEVKTASHSSALSLRRLLTCRTEPSWLGRE